MINKIFQDKPTKVFLYITAFFVANALIAECIGGKIFSLEKVFGINPSNFTLFGETGLSYSLTCGVILWPLEFIITDIVNEYFGVKAVRKISIITVVLIIYAFLMFYLAMKLPPADFWVGTGVEMGIPNMDAAFNGVFGQGMWIIFGSIVAFLFAQFIDVIIFHKIKKHTGESKVWLRATGSTFISQLVDSFIVLFIAFYIGKDWSFQKVLAIALVNYSYKCFVAILLTPLIYLLKALIEKYLTKEIAQKMKAEAVCID